MEFLKNNKLITAIIAAIIAGLAAFLSSYNADETAPATPDAPVETAPAATDVQPEPATSEGEATATVEGEVLDQTVTPAAEAPATAN